MPRPRNPKNWCLTCGKLCRNSRSNFCQKHHSLHHVTKYENSKTKKDFTSTYARHKYQKIRAHAHRKVKTLGWEKICKECKYDKYVELCHLKAIQSFEDNDSLALINHVDNLIFLCPNCHWEQEHNITCYH